MDSLGGSARTDLGADGRTDYPDARTGGTAGAGVGNLCVTALGATGSHY